MSDAVFLLVLCGEAMVYQEDWLHAHMDGVEDPFFLAVFWSERVRRGRQKLSTSILPVDPSPLYQQG